MKKILLLLPFLTSIIFAQSNFNLIVLNEGYYDYTNEEIVEPVSIGVYNSVAQTYEEIEVIDGVRFASDMIVDGEVQVDFALNQQMLQDTFPFSKLAGKKVNTLIFPTLDSANITYKLLKELNKADSIGPIMMGMRKPVHILQLGASVDEIVNMAAIAVIDAQQKEKFQH